MTRMGKSLQAARQGRSLLVGLLALVLVGALRGPAMAAPAPPSSPLGYRSTALVSVSGQVFYPSRTGNPISPTDRVAGDVLTPHDGDFDRQAAVFYVANRTVRLLHPPGSYRATAVDINSRGQVTGTAWFKEEDGEREQTYLWTSRTNTYQLLGSLGGYFSVPSALNDSGVIVGESTSAVGGEHAFIYDPAVDRGRLRDLDPRPGYVYSGATGINNAGEVVGYLGDYPGALGSAVLWTPTSHAMVDLGRPRTGDNATWATDINDGGSIVGASAYHAPMNSGEASRPARAFVWVPTTHQFRLLEARSGRPEVANAINYHGIIAGSSGGPSAQALLWNACGTSVQVLDAAGLYNGAFGINRHEHVVSSGDFGHPGTFWRRNDGPCVTQALVAR